MIEDVFVLDDEGSKKAMVQGEEIELYEPAYGYNDDLINWLKQSGLWDTLTSIWPDLKKRNGIEPQVLNGVWAIMDIAHIGKIQKVDPILRDGRIMHEVGVNIHRVHSKLKEGKGVIHRDTLRNHKKRIPVKESSLAFYRQVTLMRKRRWIRGKAYAADGFEIEVTCPDSYEGGVKKWDPDKGKWIYGYKAEILFNLSEDRPRIIGIALGPINMDERELLLTILSSLSLNVASVCEIINVLVLDRGYWGVSFFKELKEKYRIDIVTLGKSNLNACGDVRSLITLEGKAPIKRRIERKNNKGEVTLYSREMTPVKDVEVISDTGEAIKMNAVFMQEINESTGEVSETVYFTTLPVPKAPQRIVKYYDSRWGIENRCNRVLSQTWKMRVLVSRKFNAIFAQIVMVAMCYNACRIYEEKNPKEAEETYEKMRARGIESFLTDYGVIVFVPRLRIFTAMAPEECADLISKRTAAKLLLLTKEGMSLEEAIEKTVGKIE